MVGIGEGGVVDMGEGYAGFHLRGGGWAFAPALLESRRLALFSLKR